MNANHNSKRPTQRSLDRPMGGQKTTQSPALRNPEEPISEHVGGGRHGEGGRGCGAFWGLVAHHLEAANPHARKEERGHRPDTDPYAGNKVSGGDVKCPELIPGPRQVSQRGRVYASAGAESYCPRLGLIVTPLSRTRSELTRSLRPFARSCSVTPPPPPPASTGSELIGGAQRIIYFI
ncbi:hypothetical protein E2C01_058472 [Portunus trituberculatus]|uniref:Uncharacterized protein n=1 Tax=Portunus trituberculatus TaxID=210409 RepID=A0A5B7H5G8_PORTR|nr:hypothetical protein [Portunus trituberculatus]